MSAIDVRSASIDLGSWNLLVVLSLLFAAMDSSESAETARVASLHDSRAAEPVSGTGPTSQGRLMIPQNHHPSVALAHDVTTMDPLPRSRLRQTPLVAKLVRKRGKRTLFFIERFWRLSYRLGTSSRHPVRQRPLSRPSPSALRYELARHSSLVQGEEALGT